MTDLSKIPRDVEIPENALGVWAVPDLGIKVPVYSWKLNSRLPQAITDADLSACQQPYCNAQIISDHGGSEGTWYMEKVMLGMQAFYVKPEYIMAYTCVGLYIGDYHSWGYTLGSGMIYPASSKNILCVSCADASGKKAFIAEFAEEGKV